jgi:hypothetical protein
MLQLSLKPRGQQDRDFEDGCINYSHGRLMNYRSIAL